MRKLQKTFGLPLVYVGVCILLVSHLANLGRHHGVLLAGLLCIAAGCVGYVWRRKNADR